MSFLLIVLGVFLKLARDCSSNFSEAFSRKKRLFLSILLPGLAPAHNLDKTFFTFSFAQSGKILSPFLKLSAILKQQRANDCNNDDVICAPFHVLQ